MAIQTFENRSSEPNLEVKYTSYARQEFASGSGAEIVPEFGPADVVLKGQILSVIIPTLSFTIEKQLESRVTVRVRAAVEDARTKKLLWVQVATATSEFFITEDLQFNRVLQIRALEQAGQMAAQDLATQFLNHLETYGMAPAPDAATGGGAFQKSGPPRR